MIFINKIISTFFFVGKIKFAPGTFGSLITILIWYIFLVNKINQYFFIFFLFLFFIGLISVHFYLKNTNVKDPKEIVIDEVVGQSIPLMAINSTYEFSFIAISFLLFRFFDVLKIYPINKIENLPGTFGVMMDDVLAGIYALIVVILYMYILT